MSALMADHRDYADDERQPSLFDVLAPQPARPDTVEPQQPDLLQVGQVRMHRRGRRQAHGLPDVSHRRRIAVTR